MKISMKKMTNNVILKTAVGAVVVTLAVCGTVSRFFGSEEKVKIVEVMCTPEATEAPKMFEGNMPEIISNLCVIRDTKVYENLSVTGKKLDKLDIYLDKTQDKYAVICGESLVYLPIDKDGVVKLKDGVYKYWKESRTTFNFVLVGEEAVKFQKIQNEVPTGSAINVYLNDYYCKDLNCWYVDDSVLFNLDSICDLVGGRCVETSFGREVVLLNGQLVFKVNKDGSVMFEESYMNCNDVKFNGNDCVVGENFLKEVFGITLFKDGNVVSLTGELLPEIVLLESYTATGAEKKPYDGSRNGISILKVFGDYDQTSEINDGKISRQILREIR